MREHILLGLVALGFSASILACSGGTTVTTDPGVALTYGAPFILSCSEATTSVGDVDGDGHGDLVTTCKNGSSYVAKLYIVAKAKEQLAVAPGTGSGTFLDATLITGPWSDASGARFADVNGDNRPDLVVANGSVSVLLRK